MNIAPAGDIDLSDLRFISGDNPLRLRRGDILFNNTNSPAWVGKTALVDSDDELAFSNHMTRLRVSPGVAAAFVAKQLHYLCSSGYFRAQCKKHVNQASISRSFLAKSVPLMLPPENEQRRIVAKVEALQERSRRAREALEEVGPLLEQFRQSVLAAAFRGDLTADWRAEHSDVEPADELLARIRTERRRRWEEAELAKYEAKGKQPPKGWRDRYRPETSLDLQVLPGLPRGWCYARADEVVAAGTVITYGIVLPGPHVDGGVPYIRGQDIENGQILVDQLLRTTPEIHAKHMRSEVRGGDVLLCVIRHLKVALVPEGIAGVNLTQGTVRLRPSGVILGPYLGHYLAGPVGQAWMKRRHFGLAMPRINVEDARAVPIPLAPSEEQHRILALVTAALDQWTAVDSAVADASAKVADVDQSILAKAFRGELVPQDANDEPAAVLLERIRAGRAAAGGKRKAAGRGRPGATSKKAGRNGRGGPA